MEMKPWLATDWDFSEDGRTTTFHLRKDVKFQDGTPFNAEAVKYNLERVLDPETMSQWAVVMLGPVESIEVLDEYTVAVTHE
ncbi:MAG: ABC transporter substrate-binding protein, partial [Deltaproteobacteria bacterium]|nr:ABC transporter substrate-binding protein [Deltaproteobacteria bacterium]